jgi:hypothetical protein
MAISRKSSAAGIDRGCHEYREFADQSQLRAEVFLGPQVYASPTYAIRVCDSSPPLLTAGGGERA